MDLLEKIIKAKEVIGDKAAFQIAEHYHVEKFDEKNLKGCCPFHHEDTPSFIWNKKDKYFHCYGCSRKVGLLDMYIETEGSYNAALKRLFNEAGIEYDDKDLKVDRESYFDSYRFPREEPDIDKTQVYEYYSKRGISKETIDYVGVKQDKWGNAVFELRDLDDELLAVKYRPSHKIQQGQAKMWWQKDADTCPSLFNIDKVDITKPVLIVEGYSDVLAVVEAGFHNVVSIPGGAEDLNWIEFNYDILEKIPQVYLWFDNDAPGEMGRKKAQQRIGEYKCKIVKPDKDDKEAVATYYELYGATCHKTDANNVLLACGKDRIIWLIDNAEEIPVENLVDLMTAEEFDIDKTGYTPTGIAEIDKQIYGYIDGSLNIWTAYSGVGKALTLDSLLAGENGYLKMGDVKVGDKVYGEDGELHSVTGVFPQGTLDVWRINFSDKTSVECSEDHLWTVKIKSKSHDINHGVFTKTLKEIMETEKLKCENKWNICVSMCKPLKFSKKTLPVDPYTFGLSIGNEEGGLKEFDVYKTSSIEDRKALLKGILDANGEIHKDYHTYSTVSYKLLKDVEFIVNSLGGTMVYKKKSDFYTAKIRLPELAKDKKLTRSIRSIEYVGKKECQCIMVDNPSHLYLTNNCIPTHNTTLIAQTCVLEAVDRGETVFWFNAESTTSQMLNWILAQAAGRYHSIEFKRNDGFYYYKPTQEAAKMIKKKYVDKIFVYDNLLLSGAEDVLDKMKYIYMKRGTKVFVLDNWMCLNFRGVSDSEITGLQVDFMNKLIHFAKKYDLQIHLVAHPRKPQANMPLTEYDILGTSNIINMADRIFGLEKVWDEELKAMQYDRQLTVFKDRILGVKGQRIGLYYDKVTRRLYSNNIEKYKKYNWDDGSVKYQSERFGSYGLLVGERKLDCDIDPNDIQPPF